MNIEEQNLRFECLRLAISNGQHGNTVKFAQEFYDFVTGKNDGEVLAAAKEFASKLNGSTIS